jgi:hypothetical protein
VIRSPGRPRPPVLVVVEGPLELLSTEAARFRAQAYDVRDGFSPVGAVAGRMICHGRVTSAPEAAAAVLAALAGPDLLVGATADRRLAGARKALGAERTTEAIAKAGRLGWLVDPPA